MKLLKQIKRELPVMIRPSYWIQLSRYDEELDQYMIEKMKTEPIKPSEWYIFNGSTTTHYNNNISSVMFGDIKIWIKNKPYGFSIVESNEYDLKMKNIRPSRATLYEFYQLLESYKTIWLLAR